VTRRTTVVAAVNAVAWPLLLRGGYRTMTGLMIAEVNLAGGLWHVNASRSCVVNFVVAIGLRILVDYELAHRS
jgi:hypothetical protein